MPSDKPRLTYAETGGIRITIESLEWLLSQGWTLEYRKRFGRFEFRCPKGVSGSRYWCGGLKGRAFPVPVSEWIISHGKEKTDVE